MGKKKSTKRFVGQMFFFAKKQVNRKLACAFCLQSEFNFVSLSSFFFFQELLNIKKLYLLRCLCLMLCSYRVCRRLDLLLFFCLLSSPLFLCFHCCVLSSSHVFFVGPSLFTSSTFIFFLSCFLLFLSSCFFLVLFWFCFSCFCCLCY